MEEFSRRRLEEEFPYLVLDARYERVREGGVIVSRAILVALGIDWQGRRQGLAVERLETQASTHALGQQLSRPLIMLLAEQAEHQLKVVAERVAQVAAQQK